MRDRNVGNDLRAMAQDVMDIGVHYMRAGREWLEDKRHEMTGDERPHRHPRGHRAGEHRSPPPPPNGPRHRHGHARHEHPGQEQPPREQGAYRGGGPDSYLGPGGSGSPDFVSPGDTQRSAGGRDYWRRGGSGSTYGRSDFLHPGGAGGYAGIGPRSYRRSDERINEDLCERLTHDHDVDASDIEVKVADGVVTLSGSVRDRWMKHRAEDIADGCNGVHSVENRIRVRSSATGGGMAGSPGSGGPAGMGGAGTHTVHGSGAAGNAAAGTSTGSTGTGSSTGVGSTGSGSSAGTGTGTGSASGSGSGTGTGTGNISSSGPAGGKTGA